MGRRAPAHRAGCKSINAAQFGGGGGELLVHFDKGEALIEAWLSAPNPMIRNREPAQLFFFGFSSLPLLTQDMRQQLLEDTPDTAAPQGGHQGLPGWDGRCTVIPHLCPGSASGSSAGWTCLKSPPQGPVCPTAHVCVASQSRCRHASNWLLSVYSNILKKSL